MKSPTTYTTVIGLEIHVQLLTKSKMFGPEATSYGQLPNTQTSPITLAHPGTMPSINKQAVEHAIKMGLACDASITRYNRFARKNYFYPDLPKGYQITQDKTPLCQKGYITINAPEEKKIRITRIHMEEDTGKSMHGLVPNATLLDFNRAGWPLIEIVTAPDMTTPEQAYSFVTEIRRLVRYLDICDGNMEAGSMRCDANVSVMKKGTTQLGQRVEVKNMNSIRHVQLAIAHEVDRQIAILEKGETIIPATRSYNAQTGKTVHLRNKETLSEYRYFPEPDFSLLIIKKEQIAMIRDTMPLLPRELLKKFTHDYNLSVYDAGVLIDNKQIALFFETICQHTKHYKAATNWVMGPIKSFLNEQKLTIEDFPIAPDSIASVIDIVAKGSLSFSVAVAKLLPALLQTPTVDPNKVASQLGLLQTGSENELVAWVETALATYPDKVVAYKNGKKGLIGLFMGEIMKLSKGKANPQKAMALLKQKLT